jgi:hypothetical protein
VGWFVGADRAEERYTANPGLISRSKPRNVALMSPRKLRGWQWSKRTHEDHGKIRRAAHTAGMLRCAEDRGGSDQATKRPAGKHRGLISPAENAAR